MDGKLDRGLLHLAAQTRDNAPRRPASMRGHVLGNRRMSEDGAFHRVDVLVRIDTVSGALGEAGESVLSPMVAAVATRASGIFVITNSLRMRRNRPPLGRSAPAEAPDR